MWMSGSMRREWTKPHTSEHVYFHLAVRREESRLMTASALAPHMTSTKNMRGVKWRHLARPGHALGIFPSSPTRVFPAQRWYIVVE